jgi:spermidine synthase
MLSWALSFLFFLSGAASLIYETLWIRVLSLGIGSTTRAMSLVLALFFLGLSAGSYWAGKYRGRLSPLRLYGLIEGSLGLYGALVLFPLLHFSELLAWLPTEGAFAWLSHPVKFLAVGVLLTPATIAMGATLPVLVRALPTLRAGSRDGVSHWYAINTFGAVAGTLAASFFLLPKLGIVGANLAAAAVNLIVAALAFFGPSKKAEEQTTPAPSPVVSEPLDRRSWTLIGLTSLCGFASLVAEVVWNKYLGIYLGNNVYGLGLVLSVYLFGLALGAWACRYWLARSARPFGWLVTLLFLSSIFTTLATAWLNGLPILTHLTGYYLSRGSQAGVSLLGLKCLFGTVALLPATICFGALFPLTVKLLARDESTTSRAVSWAYSANTLGAIAGSYLSGVFLIPVWGSSVAIQIASVLLLAGAMVAAWTVSEKKARWAVAAVPALALVLAIRVDFSNIIKGAYSQKIEPGTTLTQALRYFATNYEEFVWFQEGETSLITLTHDPKDGESYRNYLRLKTNGLNESIYHLKNMSELPRYEALLGLLPYALSDSPKRAFVVGYGGGFTVDLLTSLPLAKVRVVELERAILQASERAYNGKNPILKRRSLDLSVEDARYVLATKAGAPWDIIVSQPSQSWLAGAANLFTREFFEIVKGNLAPTGVYSQWLNLYNMDTVVLRSILRTFYGVFPHGAVFSGENDQEMILIGSNRPLKFNGQELARLARQRPFVTKLVGVPFQSEASLLAHFVMSRERALEVSAGSPWNTDRNAFAETRQSKLFYEGVPAAESPQAFLVKHYEPAAARLASSGADPEYETLVALDGTAQHGKFAKLLERYVSESDGSPARAGKLGFLYLKAQRYESARETLARALAGNPTSAHLNLLLSALTELDQTTKVLDTARRHRRLADRVTECYEAGAELKLGRLASAQPKLNRMLADVSGYTEVCGQYLNKLVGDYYYQRAEFAQAAAFYQAYQSSFRYDLEANRRLAESYLKLGRWQEAETAASTARESAEEARAQTLATASHYEAKNYLADAEALKRRLDAPAE